MRIIVTYSMLKYRQESKIILGVTAIAIVGFIFFGFSEKEPEAIFGAGTSTLIDNFNDGSLAAAWAKYEVNGTVTETNTQMESAVNPSTSGAQSDIYTSGSYQLTGSSFTVNIKQTASPNVDTVVYLWAGADYGDRLLFTMNSGFLTAYVQDTYVTYSSNQVSGLTPGDAFYVRIREDSGTIYFDYSTDTGQSWTNLHSELVSNWSGDVDDLNIDLGTYEYSSGATTENTSIFDNVNIIPSGLVPPVIESGDVTNSGNNTSSGSWAVSHPSASTGDLIIFNIGWDDSVNVTGLTPPSGPNGESAVVIEDVVASNGTAVRGKVVYYIATGSWSASTLTFTPSASEQWTASVIKVPSGEFDPTTPIGAHNNLPATVNGNPSTPAVTAGASDGDGTYVSWIVDDIDDADGSVNSWTVLASVDRGAVGGDLVVWDAETTDSETIASASGWTTPSARSWVSFGYIVRPLPASSGGSTATPQSIIWFN